MLYFYKQHLLSGLNIFKILQFLFHYFHQHYIPDEIHYLCSYFHQNLKSRVACLEYLTYS